MRLKSKTLLKSAGGFDERCARSMESVSSLNNFNFPPQTPTYTLSLQLPNKQDIVVFLNIYSPPTKDTRCCRTLVSLFVDAMVEIHHINFHLALKLKLNSLNNLNSLWIYFKIDTLRLLKCKELLRYLKKYNNCLVGKNCLFSSPENWTFPVFFWSLY